MLEVWGAGEATVRNWQAKGYSLADLANRADLTAQQVRTPCMPLSALYYITQGRGLNGKTPCRVAAFYWVISFGHFMAPTRL